MTASSTQSLVLSVAEAAEILAVSADLVYELTERGDLPCLRIGRRKVIPRRAIELLLESVVDDFDPAAVVAKLAVRPDLEVAGRDARDRAGRRMGSGPRAACPPSPLRG